MSNETVTTASARSSVQRLLTTAREHPLGLVGFAVAFLVPFFTIEPFILGIFIEIFVFAIVVISYDLLFGFTGLLSFGHALFFGGATYALAVLATNVDGITYLSAIPIALVIVILVAIAVALVSLRLTGVYFAIITLAFGQLAYEAVLQFTSFTGGVNGISTLTLPTVFGFYLGDPLTGYYVTLFALVLAYVILRRIVNSRFGRVILGIRENEERMEMIGINVQRYKLVSFVLASVFAAFAGFLYPIFLRFIDPSIVNWTTTGDIVLMTLFGGIGSLWGPIVGTTFFIGSKEYLSTQFEQWRLILGIIFVAFVLFAPEGFAGLAERAKKLITTRITSEAADETSSDGGETK